jgi:hypothetical protein
MLKPALAGSWQLPTGKSLIQDFLVYIKGIYLVYEALVHPIACASYALYN